MPSGMFQQTFQGAILSSVSNILAQFIYTYKEKVPFSLNPAQTLKFALFSVVSSPPNIVWQTFLETQFPTNVPVSPAPFGNANGKPKPHKGPETRVSKTNVLIKFILDQTFGAVINTLMFLVFMGYANAPTTGKETPWNSIQREIDNKFYPMIMDGYKVWPLFSLASFLWIPVDKRIVAGCLVGIGWGIYLSLMVDA
ncbi:hypothetical protein CC78DRAFT_534826 [Lojkania enalia]|uniref:Uncharacterized protein n=1 Tax=Lojkania enalia TaxID=147567 RepID=A0A9P4K498_9PLEO|nr:hypothetical protein CC78DRAFT_534826 [Didymosphaeria enalia]